MDLMGFISRMEEAAGIDLSNKRRWKSSVNLERYESLDRPTRGGVNGSGQ
jgi:hypothetical protein